MTDQTPYTVPQEPGRWRAIVFATLVHLALVALLWIGVRWQNEAPTTIEAEVWSPQPKESAPPPQPVKEAVKEVPREPEKQPELPPVAKAAPKPPVDDEPPAVKPDIALEQEKKRKQEEAKKRQAEERERLAEEQKRLAEEKERQAKIRQEAERKEEQKRIELAKAEEAKKRAQAEQEKIELAKKEKAAAEKKRKQEEEKRKQEEAEAQMLAKIRDDEMRRITGAVPGGGDAAKSQGGRADGAYAQRVAAKIKSNITFNVPDELPGNPAVEYVVDLLPDGSVAGMRKTKSSGVPGFDEAVRRAIERSQPYPKDKSGTVPSSFIGIHKPKDQ
ncbi:MAG TPA: cell envelope integrity protein TolA [Noviherbaspirillum sp.]|jgi:colicin import membrane protein|uniref:cell envelope integrity protein TolA n=1 Tax=Noviherbaspirillum sp. TaxID=1926288 RepID=UPI002DDDB14A|nr:cell envelope integrity protein TolA [Noviherbaspirillum sp.]HEV2609420.1 cell envelope integrity protein TolA [Noviherbaspirillum sp.]